MYSPKEVSAYFATVQQPHSRDMFINQKFLSLDKLINQQEGLFSYKVINGTCLLNDLLNHGDVRNQIKLKNIGDLRIPLYTCSNTISTLCSQYSHQYVE